jgi:beta-mannosidase
VCVFVDRLDPDATIDQQMITLLAGEVGRFNIKSSKSLTLEQLTSPPVFRCTNPFGRH